MCSMKRVAVLASAAALAIIPAAFASPGVSHPPLLGMAFPHGTNRLVWLDPLTLKVKGSQSLNLPAFSTWRQSPDASRLVFSGHAGTLRFVDANSLRMIGTVRLPGFTDPDMAWATPRTLFVFDTLSIAAVDPVTLRVKWRKRLPTAFTPFGPESEASTPSGLIFLLSPMDGSVGATTLVSVDLAGRFRSIVLPQIQSGATQDPSGASLFTGSQPGLAIDPVGGQAYIVGGTGTVAQVDLSTLAVSSHNQPRTLAHADKVLSGPTREAIWLGDGLIAVTGENDRAWLDANHKYQETVSPAGLTIIDTRTWTTRLVDPGVSAVTVAGGTLLASGESWDTTTGTSNLNPTGEGLNAYTTAGTLAFHLLGQTPVQQVRSANGLAYAWQLPTNPKRPATTTVFDSASGQVLHTITTTARLAPVPLIAY